MSTPEAASALVRCGFGCELPPGLTAEPSRWGTREAGASAGLRLGCTPGQAQETGQPPRQFSTYLPCPASGASKCALSRAQASSRPASPIDPRAAKVACVSRVSPQDWGLTCAPQGGSPQFPFPSESPPRGTGPFPSYWIPRGPALQLWCRGAFLPIFS